MTSERRLELIPVLIEWLSRRHGQPVQIECSARHRASQEPFWTVRIARRETVNQDLFTALRYIVALSMVPDVPMPLLPVDLWMGA